MQADELVVMYKDIQAKMREMGITPDPPVEKGLADTIRFFETADQRSRTIANRLIEINKAQHRSAPIAAIIGAAHFKTMRRILGENGLSVVLVRAIAFDFPVGRMSIDEFERKSVGRWGRASEGTLGLLLNPDRMPAPITETATGKSHASGLLAATLVSEAARNGKSVPVDIQASLRDLPECDVDTESFEKDGFDVIFSMTLRRTDNSKKQVWVRVGTVEPGTREPAKTLEEKLLEKIKMLAVEGGETPNSRANTNEEKHSLGPGDEESNGLMIQRINPSTVAVFAESKQSALSVGRISG